MRNHNASAGGKVSFSRGRLPNRLFLQFLSLFWVRFDWLNYLIQLFLLIFIPSTLEIKLKIKPFLTYISHLMLFNWRDVACTVASLVIAERWWPTGAATPQSPDMEDAPSLVMGRPAMAYSSFSFLMQWWPMHRFIRTATTIDDCQTRKKNKKWFDT